MTDPDWPSRLKAAADRLDQSPGVPDWLKAVMRDAVAVAPALAPVPEAEPVPQDFFYPH